VCARRSDQHDPTVLREQVDVDHDATVRAHAPHAAENEPAFRTAVASQPATGGSPNIDKAVEDHRLL